MNKKNKNLLCLLTILLLVLASCNSQQMLETTPAVDESAALAPDSDEVPLTIETDLLGEASGEKYRFNVPASWEVAQNEMGGTLFAERPNAQIGIILQEEFRIKYATSPDEAFLPMAESDYGVGLGRAILENGDDEIDGIPTKYYVLERYNGKNAYALRYVFVKDYTIYSMTFICTDCALAEFNTYREELFVNIKNSFTFLSS
ncbi:MAG: hypothetical protein H6658_01165 [Ardenticatenaceae bacterium]|nr:hypothetical protein [Ardenticatenaceae bacterium]